MIESPVDGVPSSAHDGRNSGGRTSSRPCGPGALSWVFQTDLRLRRPFPCSNARPPGQPGHQWLGYALSSELYVHSLRPANVARFVFLRPPGTRCFADWERAANDIVAILRTEAGRNPYDRGGRI